MFHRRTLALFGLTALLAACVAFRAPPSGLAALPTLPSSLGAESACIATDATTESLCVRRCEAGAVQFITFMQRSAICTVRCSYILDARGIHTER